MNGENKTRKLTQKMQSWLTAFFCFFLVALIGLIVRICFITSKDKYVKKALEQQSYVSSVIPYKRGNITDRNGQILAESELVYNLILDPKVILSNTKYVDPSIKALTEVYGLNEAEIRQTLTEKSKSSYVILKKKLKYEDKQKFQTYVEKASNSKYIKGVWFEEEYIRYYPYDTAASHVIGFVSTEGNGTYGIEEFYDEELRGNDGRTYGYYDSELNILRTTKEAEDGNNIVSTIDVNVQQVVQKHVEKFMDTVGADNVGVIMMDASNAEILALQSNYSFNLNTPRNIAVVYGNDAVKDLDEKAQVETLYKMWHNFCVNDGYEPGSTFKPFTVAAALDENVVTEASMFYCDGKEVFPGNVTVKCSNVNGHGNLGLAETLMLSCNDCLMQIAALEGKDMFYSYQQHFRFGDKTGVDLPGEAKGELIALKNLNATELATSSFGQSFTVNMVQMASGFASLINGGNYYKPHVVSSITNEEGAVIKKFEPVLLQKTVSEETSAFIRKAMLMTVESGTAKKAAVKGYVIGGKTGTAQKFPRADKKNLVSFLGFVSAADRDIVVYVVVDVAHDPAKMKSSATALTLASEIMEEALPYLKIYPEGEIDYHVESLTDEEIIRRLMNNPMYDPNSDESNPNVIE